MYNIPELDDLESLDTLMNRTVRTFQNMFEISQQPLTPIGTIELREYARVIRDYAVDIFVQVQHKCVGRAEPSIKYPNGEVIYCVTPISISLLKSKFIDYADIISRNKNTEYNGSKCRFSAIFSATTLTGTNPCSVILGYALKHIISISTFGPTMDNDVSITAYSEKLADIYNYMCMIIDILSNKE